MKPISDEELENEIVNQTNGIRSSNEIHQKLNVGKSRYTRIRDQLIEQGVIKKERIKNRMYLSVINFGYIHPPKDIVEIPRVNLENYLKNLKKLKPIGIISKNKTQLKSKPKKILDALFWQLDILYAIQTRMIYAQSFGMMSSRHSSIRQKMCKRLFSKSIEKLFKEHKPFKQEIIQQYQSKLRQLKFNL